MKFYVARYADNGKVEYWSGIGTLFVNDIRDAARFNLSDAVVHANWFKGFIEAS